MHYPRRHIRYLHHLGGPTALTTETGQLTGGAGTFSAGWSADESFFASMLFSGAVSKAQGGEFFDAESLAKGLAIGAAVKIAMGSFIDTQKGQAKVAGEGGKQNLHKIEGVYVLRQSVDAFADVDQYGHYWTELGPDESYGWYPKGKDISIWDMIFGVDGEMNGVTNHKGTPTQDPHHGKWGEGFTDTKVYEVYGSVTTDQAISALRSFSNSYSSINKTWSYPFGSNCRSFQQEMLDTNHLILREVQR